MKQIFNYNKLFKITNLNAVLAKLLTLAQVTLANCYQLVTPSPWPILMSLRLLNLTLNTGATSNTRATVYAFNYILSDGYGILWKKDGYLVYEALVFLMLFWRFFHGSSEIFWSFFYGSFAIFWRVFVAPAMGIRWLLLPHKTRLFLGISLSCELIRRLKQKAISYLVKKL